MPLAAHTKAESTVTPKHILAFYWLARHRSRRVTPIPNAIRKDDLSLIIKDSRHEHKHDHKDDKERVGEGITEQQQTSYDRIDRGI